MPDYPPTFRGFLRMCAALGETVEPHQRLIARAVLDGPEREVAAILARGNFKTTTAALIGVHHLLSVDGASIAVGASSRDQARIAFERMRDFATRDAITGQLTVRHLELRADHGGLLRVIPSDGPRAHGLSSTMYIADEVWSWKEAALLEAMQTGLVKRPDAKLLVISTSASALNSPLGRLRTRALAQTDVHRDGVRIDARGTIRWLEWSAPDDADPDDLALAARVNPSRYLTAAMLGEARQRVPEVAYRQFHLCQWDHGAATWLPPGAWSACLDDEPVPGDEPVWLGVDIGGSRAASAIIGVTADLRVAVVEIFEGDDAVLAVTEAVRRIAAERPVHEVAFDPWRYQGEALRLEADGIGPMVQFNQSHSRMTVASEGLHAAVVERRLRHPGHPVLDAHVASAVARQTGRGWRLDTADRTAQIDGCIAMAMAVERAQHRPAPVRVLAWL